MEMEIKDDGTLSCLGINVSNETRQFNCDVITQNKLVNTSFYIVDFINDIKTKYGNNRILVKIKYNLNDLDSDSKKFFTNSNEIKLILNKIKEMNKFPRKVTMRSIGNRYFIE